MATFKQYALKIWDTHRAVSQKLGADISTAELTDRVNAVTTDVILAGLVKALTDAGVITDAQLNAAYNAIKAAPLPPLPAVVTPTSDNPAGPDPDLGA